IAENFWAQGISYNDELIKLLHAMLQLLSWQETLARACAELLEGEWAERYLAGLNMSGPMPLWPSQRLGIAQALWVIDNCGSVLVADATGSGKTKMGASLVKAVRDKLWSSGRARNDLVMLVSPPSVETNWQNEAFRCGLNLATLSSGKVSRVNVGTRQHQLQRAQILAVDEAHNYLNRESQRTTALRDNRADSVVLFTATPINRHARDLVSLVNLLGPDNMETETLNVLERLGKMSGGQHDVLGADDMEVLRQQIRQFTVRRTKQQLNELVDRDPEAYRSIDDTTCRYPTHVAHVYDTGETRSDRDAADTIRSLAASLTGIGRLESTLVMPAAFAHQGIDDATYLSWRLTSSAALAAHQVMACLRSSRAALHEHLYGTEAAAARYGLSGIAKNPTGAVIAKLEERALGGPPTSRLTCELPTWLTDANAFAHECEAEAERYRAIGQALEQISDAREVSKAQRVALVAKSQHRVLAFDQRPISLVAIEHHLTKRTDTRVVVAHGGATSERADVLSAMARSSEERCIALCSDAMSESINLQGASVVVHLDLPTTVRIAEQRVGRVDRMDSPHSAITIWWPQDGPSFSTTATEKLADRLEMVEQLLGANVFLPAELKAGTVKAGTVSGPAVKVADLIAESEAAAPWDGIGDAFEPVRQIVDGDQRLLFGDVYEHAVLDMHAERANWRRGHGQATSTRISFVESTSPWAFFSLCGSDSGAPRWVFLDGRRRMVTGLDHVASELRRRLGDTTVAAPFDEHASSALDMFVERLLEAELALLPRRKQRLVEQMRAVVEHHRRAAVKVGNDVLAQRWRSIADATTVTAGVMHADLSDVADRWHDLIWPLYTEAFSNYRKARPFTLDLITKDLMAKAFSIDEVEAKFGDVPMVPPPEERISAGIVGVGRSPG
ncbi:MAG: SNF2-related protein, partial [Acidimicrobiia bacterium]